MSKKAPLGEEYTVEYPLNVRLTSCKFRCTKCGKWKPGGDFGLRCVNEVVRNQPQCKSCRSGGAKLKLVQG